MRLEQSCPCGAQIVVVYNADLRSWRDQETGEAHKQIDTFRRSHRDCLKGRQGQVKVDG